MHTYRPSLFFRVVVRKKSLFSVLLATALSATLFATLSGLTQDEVKLLQVLFWLSGSIRVSCYDLTLLVSLFFYFDSSSHNFTLHGR